MRRLKISDVGPAEDGYPDLLNTISRKPYPGIDGLRNVQRLMKVQNPRIADVIRAMKPESAASRQMIRFSLDAVNTAADVQSALTATKRATELLRG
jgi:hypothetical protein